jgi:hypothetical protein
VGHEWTERLSQYTDGELTAADRVALEAHLATCEECTRTLQELERVVARARHLEDRPPTAELWSAIAARIDTAPAADDVVPIDRPRRRTISFTMPQLAAAAIAAVLLSASGAFLALRVGSSTPAPLVVVEAPTVTVSPVGFDEARYGAAVLELEQVLAAGRDRLDTATVRILETNLQIIDAALADAQAALAADPANAYLSGHLADTMRRKVALLKRATALVAAAS